LEHLDILDLLERYVLRPNKVRALLYLDPPYVVAKKFNLYAKNFDAVDHLLLADQLRLINQRNGGQRNVRIVLTYDDDPLIRAFYRPEFGWHVGRLALRYGGKHAADPTDEILITNFAPGGEFEDDSRPALRVGTAAVQKCKRKENICTM
jgi:site-specific DNA-adenine methylase